MKKREQNNLIICLAISATLHLLFFIFFVVLGGTILLAHLLHINPPRQKEETPKLVLLQTKPVQPRQFIETDASQQTKERTKQTPFYSDRNTLAADQSSKRDQNQPEIKGRNKDTLATEEVILTKNTPPAGSKQPHPQEKSKQQPAEKNQANEDFVKKQYALLKPHTVEATPVKPEEIPVEAEKVEPEELISPDNARARAPPSKSLQRSIPTEASTLTGGINRKGVISFDTQESPAGYYDKILLQTISQRWHLLVGDRYRNQAGTVRVEFDLRADGQVSNISVQPDDSVGPILANLCKQAIVESAPFRPFPNGLRAICGDSRHPKIAFQYSFY